MGADLSIFANQKPDSRQSSVGRSNVPRSKGTTTVRRGVRGQRIFSEAYFRDSYNAYNVLWTFGLSWWKDVIPLLNQDSELMGENLTRFRNRIASADQRLPTVNELAALGLRVTESGENSLEALHRNFRNRRKELLKFLDLAIKHDLPVLCSL